MLENHANSLANFGDVLVGDEDFVEIDFATSGFFNAVDAAEES